MGSTRVRAQDFERIRSESALLTSALETASERSATFRSMAERIERSDVIVHLTCSRFRSVLMAGRTALASAGPDVRYVRVEILCQQPEYDLVAILAHELEHVLEIAAAPSVVDDRSFSRLYRAIGFSTHAAPTTEQFETTAAMAAGQRVRQEFLHVPDPGIGLKRPYARSGHSAGGGALAGTVNLERTAPVRLTD